MRKKKIRITDLIIEAVVIVASTLILVPLLVMVFGSFKSSSEALLFDVNPPSRWLWSNFKFVFVEGGLGRALLNSVIVTSTTLILCVGTSALCSFVIARKRTFYTRALDTLFLLGMIAPMQTIPTFATLKVLNLIGSYAGVILVITAVTLPWIVFLFIRFIHDLPVELDEAAYIDGLSALGIFFKIVLPISQPILATATVMTAMMSWNEFMIPLYFLDTQEKWTMPLTVYNFFGQYFSDWNYVFADLLITALPVTVLYLYLQKYIISGMTEGALKG
jgi:raffinose/stachyose/melibiose transport system permease protein